VTEIYYLELLRASECTLSYWSRLHFAVVGVHSSLKGLTSGRRPVVKINVESLSQHDEEHVVPTLLSGIRVGRRVAYQDIKKNKNSGTFILFSLLCTFLMTSFVTVTFFSLSFVYRSDQPTSKGASS
jgi:hypothetical protein